MIKICLYYNHYNSFGHSLRTYNLLSYLKANLDVELLILQGGKRQRLLDFGRLGKVILLPHSYAKKGMFVDRFDPLHSKVLSSPWGRKAMSERISVILSEIESFSPDVFITEYFPLGDAFWTEELYTVLEAIRPKVRRIYCSCGYVSHVRGADAIIGRYYDKIFIHSTEDFLRLYLREMAEISRGVQDLLAILDRYRDRIVYTGFVIDTKTSPLDIPKDFVMVSRGGGVINDRIISLAIVLAKRMPNDRFVLVLGPSSRDDLVEEVRKVAPDNVTIYESLPLEKFNFLLSKCRLSINMAGYNTITKLIYWRKPTVIYPLDAVEQLARASVVGRFIPARVIEGPRMPVNTVAGWIRELGDETPTHCLREEDFKGESVFLREILNDVTDGN